MGRTGGMGGIFFFLLRVFVSSWFLTSTVASGQSLGTLRVTVLDPSGAVIVGAHVTVADVTTATGGRGEAAFGPLDPGRYTVRVESAGFETATVRDVRVRGGDNRREVKLAIAKLAETVQVGRDARAGASDPRGDAFATVLGQAEIDELPDDPDEMEQLLRDMTGPGAVMRVNGFRGGKLPKKDQIQQIRFRRNMFAADTHELGFVFIDITTKPGLDGWRGSTNVGFRDSTLNARNAFAPVKGDERNERYGFTLTGPLRKEHTSMSISVEGVDAFDTKTIVAALPSGFFADSVRKPNDALNTSLRVEHMLTHTQMLRSEFQRSHTTADNLGVGDFDLPERAYSQTRDENVFRASLSGSMRKSLFNDLRVQWRTDDFAFAPLSTAPAVLVLNAFDSGGAQVAGSRGFDLFELNDDLDIAAGRHAVRAGRAAERVRHLHVRQPRRVRARPADDVHAQPWRSARRDRAVAARALCAGRHPRAEGADDQRGPAAGSAIAHRRGAAGAARRYHLVAVQERQDDGARGGGDLLRLAGRAGVRTGRAARRHASAD